MGLNGNGSVWIDFLKTLRSPVVEYIEIMFGYEKMDRTNTSVFTVLIFIFYLSAAGWAHMFRSDYLHQYVCFP